MLFEMIIVGELSTDVIVLLSFVLLKYICLLAIMQLVCGANSAGNYFKLLTRVVHQSGLMYFSSY